MSPPSPPLAAARAGSAAQPAATEQPQRSNAPPLAPAPCFCLAMHSSFFILPLSICLQPPPSLPISSTPPLSHSLPSARSLSAWPGSPSSSFSSSSSSSSSPSPPPSPLARLPPPPSPPHLPCLLPCSLSQSHLRLPCLQRRVCSSAASPSSPLLLQSVQA